MSAYRDDLEAAQLRASDLERDIQQLRARNAELEQRRADNARRLLDERVAQQRGTKAGRGRQVLLISAWIGAVVLAVRLSAPWAAILVSIAFLVIMALSPFTGTGSEDRE